MFDKDKIKSNVLALCSSRGISYGNSVILDYEIDKAINYGCRLRHSSYTEKELEKEKKDYSFTLTSMVMSALQLHDKLGMKSSSEGGVSNTFEDGNIYQKQDTYVFTPLARFI